ncbi:MAG TPA: hemerythrin domain-containing protein [Polyangia bacterium]|nr:hemerythrin domain-containing protein [Polyangia bacterium]
MNANETTRRRFILAGGMGVAGAALGGAALAKTAPKKDDDDVPPTEDLMREHGVLRRLLLVYGELVRRVDARQEVKAEHVSGAALIIREFIEDYHEKDEEEYVFPRLQKAGKLGELVTVLIAQHAAGRRVTADVLRLATPAGLQGDAGRKQLAEALRSFVRMYEPHAAREDTVLFPAFRALLDERELKKLQDVFEDKEKALPHGGFEKMVGEVAKLEQALGLYDLAKFTPA